jgi:aldehyde:ferredoxin oxidoreductase
MKDEYYLLRGWNPGTGFQKKDSLRELGLSDLIDPLEDKVL